MDSVENNQEVTQAFQKAQAGSAEEAANNILNMWNSEEQPASEETETTVDEEVVEEIQEDEVETEEDSVEEETTEEVEETEETEEQVEEEVEEEVEPSTYKVKVNGEEFEVDIDELKAGYQRQSDYTRKSQELAEQRKQTESINEERIRLEQERQMYANALQTLAQDQQAKLKEYESIDWNTLKEDDPYQYMLKKDEYNDVRAKMDNARKQQTLIQQQQQEQAMRARADFVQDQYTKLIEQLPEWADKNSTVKDDIRKFAIDSGYAPEEVEQLADHRSVLILKKAMEFDKLTSKVAPKKKAVKTVPKVQKSGRGKPKGEEESQKAKKKRTQLRKSGQVKDAASVFYDML